MCFFLSFIFTETGLRLYFGLRIFSQQQQQPSWTCPGIMGWMNSDFGGGETMVKVILTTGQRCREVQQWLSLHKGTAKWTVLASWFSVPDWVTEKSQWLPALNACFSTRRPASFSVKTKANKTKVRKSPNTALQIISFHLHLHLKENSFCGFHTYNDCLWSGWGKKIHCFH